MKLIFLNALNGQIDTVKDFIQKQSSNTDIFCFQESFNYSQNRVFCLDWLKNYQHFFANKEVNQTSRFTNSTFVKNKYLVSDTKIVGQGELTIGLGLYTQIKSPDKQTINLLNFHGHPRPGDKQDNPNRLNQSKLIIDFFKKRPGIKIIGGDFNLDFDTKSLRLFEQNGYRNLIKEFNIATTRNKIAWDKYPTKQLYADFLLISPDVKVKHFSVPSLIISDHLPLILEIETN